MDRDDAGMSDRSEQARQGDTGMIGSESEDPGPGRDTSLTDPTEQPQGTVAMSEDDPMRTRLGSHVEGAGAIGYDVAASEEGAATQQTPAEDRPAYESERLAGDAPATYTGEEEDVTGRPEYAERAEGGGDQDLYQQEVQRADRPGGGGFG